jgi:hypothetical protein
MSSSTNNCNASLPNKGCACVVACCTICHFRRRWLLRSYGVSDGPTNSLNNCNASLPWVGCARIHSCMSLGIMENICWVCCWYSYQNLGGGARGFSCTFVCWCHISPGSIFTSIITTTWVTSIVMRFSFPRRTKRLLLQQQLDGESHNTFNIHWVGSWWSLSCFC